MYEGVHLSLGHRPQAVLDGAIRSRSHAFLRQVGHRRGPVQPPYPHVRQVLGPGNPGVELRHGEARGDGGREEGDDDDRREHPDEAHDSSPQRPGSLVPVSHGGHRHRRPPESASDPLRRGATKLLAVLGTLKGPDQHPPEQEEGHQEEEDPPQVRREESQHRSADPDRLAAHGDAQAGDEERMGEVHALLAAPRDGQGRRRGEERPVLDSIQHSLDLPLLEVVLEPQLVGHVLPEVDGEAGVAPVPFVHDERGHHPGADEGSVRLGRLLGSRSRLRRPWRVGRERGRGLADHRERGQAESEEEDSDDGPEWGHTAARGLEHARTTSVASSVPIVSPGPQ